MVHVLEKNRLTGQFEALVVLVEVLWKAEGHLSKLRHSGLGMLLILPGEDKQLLTLDLKHNIVPQLW